MSSRVLALAAVAAMLAAPAAAGPRPDLSGAWTNAWYTFLERPKELKTLVVAPPDAEAYEQPRRAHHGMLPSKPDEIGQVESEFPDLGPGLARIRGQIRSSWLVEPSDGRLPYIPAVKDKLGVGKPEPETYDNVEERPTDERCLSAAGSVPPMVNSADANIFEIVQTPDHLAILSEKNHEVRIVPLDGRRPPNAPTAYAGVPVAHWEGATLVVETAGLPPGVSRVGRGVYLSDKARVVERFTRISRSELSYEFFVHDPGHFTRPWSGEMVFRASPEPLYEFACHEGNYSLPTILAGGRVQAQTKAAGN